MRPDMERVIIERPRKGGGYGGKGYRRSWQHVPPEEWRKHESIKARSRGGTKYFTDLLGPLRRFLRSNVGRPWDAIHSEICASVGRGFPGRDHFMTHVDQFVRRNVVVIDGIVCSGGPPDYGRPLDRRHGWVFYVCPRTGLLREVERPRRR